MKHELFPAPFSTISSNLPPLICKNGHIPFWHASLTASLAYDNFLQNLPQPICPSKSYEYDKYDTTTYRVSLYC